MAETEFIGPGGIVRQTILNSQTGQTATVLNANGNPAWTSIKPEPPALAVASTNHNNFYPTAYFEDSNQMQQTAPTVTLGGHHTKKSQTSDPCHNHARATPIPTRHSFPGTRRHQTATSNDHRTVLQRLDRKRKQHGDIVGRQQRVSNNQMGPFQSHCCPDVKTDNVKHNWPSFHLGPCNNGHGGNPIFDDHGGAGRHRSYHHGTRKHSVTKHDTRRRQKNRQHY